MQETDRSLVEQLVNIVGFFLSLAGFVWLTVTPADTMPRWHGLLAAYWLLILAAILIWVLIPVWKGFRTGDFVRAFLEALRSIIFALIFGAVIWFIVSKLK